MARPPDLGGFAAVDRTPSPAAYTDFLDTVRGVGAVAEWKERSFALMRPRPGAALADLGCGTGEDVLALAERVSPGGRAIGVDASTTMIAEARRRADLRPGVELRVGDVRALDLPDGALDGCRAERLLIHLERPEEAVAEMARVLRSGGRAVVAEPDWGTLAVDAPELRAGRLVALAAAGRFRSPYAGRALRRLLLEAGLAEVEVHARTLLIDDGWQAEALFGLADAARLASEVGFLDAARAAAWHRGAERAAAAGRLMVAITAFMAAGSRP